MRMLVAIGAAWLAACGPSSSESVSPPVHLRYTSTDVPCAGSAAYLAAVARSQAAFLDVPLPADIEFVYQPSGASFPCPAEATACYSPRANQIWSHDAINEHELVHAILYPLFGDGVPLLREGVAVALGGDDPGPSDYTISPSELITAWNGSPTEYATAGDFVSWLLSSYGAAAFTSVYASATLGSSLQQVDDAFTATYGSSFSTMYSQRAASAARFSEDRLRLPECAASAIPWTEPQWRATVELDCRQTGAGPTPDGVVFRRNTFDLPAAAVLSFSIADLRSDGVRFVHVGDCASPASYFDYALPSPAIASMYAKNPLIAAPLNGGRHFISFVADRQTTTTFDVLAAAQTFAGASCSSLSPVDLDGSVGGLYAAPLPDGSSLFALFRSAQPRTARAYAEGTPTSLCVGACDLSSCTRLSTGDPVSLSAGQVYTMVWNATAPGGLSGIVFP